MYAAQQQHLMLQTAALQQQHLSSAQLQSLAAVQQASLAATRQGSSPNGNVSQQPASSQTTINLATSPAAAQLISRAQTVNSGATGIAQQAVLLGNSNSPALTASQAQMYLRAQMVQNLAIRNQQSAATAAAVQPQLQSVTLKATAPATPAPGAPQAKTPGSVPAPGSKGGQPDSMADSGKKGESGISASGSDTRSISVAASTTPVSTHPLITTAYTQLQPHQLIQQQQFQLQQQQQKHLQHQFVIQQQPPQITPRQQQPQLIHTPAQLQNLQQQQPVASSATPHAQHCQPALHRKQQGLSATPPAQIPVLQPVPHSQQSLQQTDSHALAPQTTAVNLQVQPSAHVIQQSLRSGPDSRRDKPDPVAEKGPVEKPSAPTTPGPSATPDQRKAEPTKPVTQGKGPETVNAKSPSPAPTMTSGNGSTTSSVTVSVPQNAENKPPQAIVKPQILTHVIEGFVIQEGAEPFPVGRSSLLIDNLAKQKQQAASVPAAEKPAQLEQPDSEMDDLSQQDSMEKEEDALKLKCEFCGRLDYAYKFKGSKRFCSMACAKRYNVGCSKRVGLFKPDKSKYLQKKESGKLGKRGPRKNSLHGGNSEQPKKQLKSPVPVGLSQEDSSRGSDNSSYEEPLSPISASSSTSRRRQAERELDVHELRMRDLMGIGHHFLPSDPTKWNVEDVCEFIRSLPGCQEIADEFRAQEIDGQALLLLKEDHLMSAMNIKLGPALKIYARISMLKDS
ncbi:polyhomeotic-like protein 2 isoform X6 [Hemitrygon akajei]|uniref:polyhomeotic-like protein 2 isoform X6 n=1 Tax=Hemitrygon akajei TaxID=2704970 RepID=UPI003BF94228